ncbi:hypothetical protein A3A52_02025 [Candidatus Woesebacteria bacterium RIFCSPLOWO2_01_FULL_39_14]|uniref:Uncharacterized protein n=1 Tax=Candidatus Woesebacteria bacterium RIFCSPLOWO2_01_FULL_39_14 TaxID=1802518 RepID=A0A1F8BD94_9BACT|nr:MAG: hypothetical protein A3A52_02025 [Candidatus Woesebacteria bacterium RIFCSPLOWO2_01_FULL_39_14]
MSPKTLYTVTNITTEGDIVSTDIWRSSERGSANLTGLDETVGSGSRMTEQAVEEAARATRREPSEIITSLQKGEIVRY